MLQELLTQIWNLWPAGFRIAGMLDRAAAVAAMSSMAIMAFESASTEAEPPEVATADSAENQLRAQNAALEARIAELTRDLSIANNELESFSYSVSHDLRAPLRTIDGFGLALLEDCGDKLDDVGKGHLQRIRASTQRMGTLIDDLIHLSRVTRAPLAMQPVNLSAMALLVSRELAAAEPARQVAWQIEPDLAVTGDAKLLRVVIENLLNNAWKFTSRRPAASISFGRMEENGSPVFFVRDDGAGFDPTYADRLFGAFQRLHSPGEFPGTGLGLAIVQRVIRRHGGRIWAAGVPDHGATFFFTVAPTGAEPSVVAGAQV